MPAPQVQAPVPLLWQVVTECCGLRPDQAALLWRALRRSTWTQPTAWRRALMAADPLIKTPEGATTWITEHAQPHQLIDLLDDLVRAGEFSQYEANQLMRPLLDRTNRHGGWK